MEIKKQLQQLQQIKNSIKTAIINKGVSVSDDTPFKDYATLISQISSTSQAVITDSVVTNIAIGDEVTGNITDSITII